MKNYIVLVKWLLVSMITIPNISYANSSDVICPSNARSSTVYDVAVDTCKATLEALDCKNIVSEDQIRDCDQRPPSPYATSRYFNSQNKDGLNPLQATTARSDEETFRACVIGFKDSGVETWNSWVVENVSDLLEFMASPSLPSLPSIETIGENISHTWNFTSMTASYLWTEYQRAGRQTGGAGVPINTGVMAANIATPVIVKVKAAIEEEVTHLQCLKEEIQANIICNFLGDIFIPPGGFVAFLKVGKVAAKTFPSVERAFMRLDQFMKASSKGQQLLKPADRIIIQEKFDQPVDTDFDTIRSIGVDITPDGWARSPARIYNATATVEGKPHNFTLVIPDQKNTSANKLLKKMETVLSELPGNSLRSVKAIILNPHTKRSFAGPQRPDSNTTDNLRRIHLAPVRYKSNHLSNILGTMRHELGHTTAVHKYGNFTPDNKYVDAAKKDNRSVSPYGDSGYNEDFAEAMRVYIETDGGIKNPTLLRRYANRFEVLDEIMQLDTNARRQILDEFRVRMARQEVFWTTTAAGGLTTLTVGNQTAAFVEQELLNEVTDEQQ